MVPIITFVIFYISFYKVLIINTVFILIYLIRISNTYFSSLDSLNATIIISSYSCLLIGITLTSAFVGYMLEKGKRNEFIYKKKLEFQYHKGQDILGNLLPSFVKN